MGRSTYWCGILQGRCSNIHLCNSLQVTVLIWGITGPTSSANLLELPSIRARQRHPPTSKTPLQVAPKLEPRSARLCHAVHLGLAVFRAPSSYFHLIALACVCFQFLRRHVRHMNCGLRSGEDGLSLGITHHWPYVAAVAVIGWQTTG